MGEPTAPVQGLSAWQRGRLTLGSTDTYDITGADVLQTIEWAQRQAGDTLAYAIALVCDDKAAEQFNSGHGRGLVWLVGMDGNDTPFDATEEDRQRRMLLRRATPIAIPTADRMPTDALDPDKDRPMGRDEQCPSIRGRPFRRPTSGGSSLRPACVRSRRPIARIGHRSTPADVVVPLFTDHGRHPAWAGWPVRPRGEARPPTVET